MSEITFEPKRGRGRPRKYANEAARLEAIAQRKTDRATDKAILTATKKADAKSAALPMIHWLLITVKQAAEALQISERTVFMLIDEGFLESVKIGGSRRVSMDSVKALASTGTKNEA